MEEGIPACLPAGLDNAVSVFERDKDQAEKLDRLRAEQDELLLRDHRHGQTEIATFSRKLLKGRNGVGRRDTVIPRFWSRIKK
jgi:hypothetical protein